MKARILHGDVLAQLATLPDESVHTCVTSPPYWGLRDYGHEGQIGLEPTPELYVAKMVEVFREVKRVLRPDGTLWLNLGDSYAGGTGLGRNDAGRDFTGGGGNIPGSGNPGRQGSFKRQSELKPKDLCGIPWMVAFALRADGWYLRQEIIWHKPNPMPESVTDRCTKAHEHIFLLAKNARYYFDSQAIREGEQVYTRKAGGYTDHWRVEGLEVTRKTNAGGIADRDTTTIGANKRSVWTVSTKPFSEAHFATFPPDLIEPCILAGCPEGGTVLDPFNGSGTTGLVALRHRRNYIGIELNAEYVEMTRERIQSDCPMFYEVQV